MVDEYNNLYTHFKDDPNARKDLIIAKVNCGDQQQLCRSIGVYSFPYLALFVKGNSEGYEYDGSKTKHHFLQFIHQYLKEENVEKSDSESGNTEEGLKDHHSDDQEQQRLFQKEQEKMLEDEQNEHMDKSEEFKEIQNQEGLIENQQEKEKENVKKIEHQQHEIKKEYEQMIKNFKKIHEELEVIQAKQAQEVVAKNNQILKALNPQQSNLKMQIAIGILGSIIGLFFTLIAIRVQRIIIKRASDKQT